MEQEQRRPVGHMEYMEGMEQIDSDILAKVIAARNSYLAETYVDKDVKNALEHDVCTIEDFAALLSPSALPFLEQMAEKAKQ